MFLALIAIELFSISAFYAVTDNDVNSSIQNEYLVLDVEQDDRKIEYLRFKLKTNVGEVQNYCDDNTQLLYDNFFSGYTTISINGQQFSYGTGENNITSHFNSEKGQHISSYWELKI